MAYAQEEPGKKAFGMGMAMAVNGSIIAAIILSPLIVNPPERRERTTTFDIPDRQPPPPDKPRIEKQNDTQRQIDPIFTPPTPYTPERDDPGPTVTDIDPGPPLGTGVSEIGGKGGGEVGTREIVDPPPLPFTGSKRDPKFARSFQPDYPPGLLSKEIEGDAVLKVLIAADGRVREAIVVRATHPDFGKYAVKKALSSWRFIPATRGGKPVEDWQTIPIRFKITT
jgi:periplasmic protein TonB